MTYVYISLSALATLAVLGVLLGLRMEREYERGVIFRLGRFQSVRGPGLYWVIPFVDQKTRVDIRTRTVEIEAQETVTSDSVTIRVNAVLYYRVTEPEKAIISVANFSIATYQIALTTLRSIWAGQETSLSVSRYFRGAKSDVPHTTIALVGLVGQATSHAPQPGHLEGSMLAVNM